ncbi:MAG TPA: hypothetical protein VFI87_06500, partial [Hyphomicrobiaceae bacterium]|nr:hypothetical protein [Hyphomicrobiaceae bacterium]
FLRSTLRSDRAVTRPSNQSIARQIGDVNAQIADTELSILQSQKRVENRLAKGADVTELRSAIAVLTETLTYLEACKVRLQEQRQGCGDH